MITKSSVGFTLNFLKGGKKTTHGNMRSMSSHPSPAENSNALGVIGNTCHERKQSFKCPTNIPNTQQQRSKYNLSKYEWLSVVSSGIEQKPVKTLRARFPTRPIGVSLCDRPSSSCGYRDSFVQLAMVGSELHYPIQFLQYSVVYKVLHKYSSGKCTYLACVLRHWNGTKWVLTN